MQGSERQDVRKCWVEGASFDGVAPLLERQKGFGDVRAVNPELPELNAIYIHGMGTHVPGHGALLVEGLAETLALNVQSKRAKRVELVSPTDPSQILGELNLLRLTNEERSLDLVFYELTWSEITRPIRDSLAFDESTKFSSRRASINHEIRCFTN